MKSLVIFLAVIVVLTQAGGCWLRSHGRGAGKVLTTCSAGQDKNGALCYPKCKDGYKGVGPVCWKFPKSYGRGAGRPLKCADGLEQSGALCYPRCSNGYHGIGPVCWGSCPAGYKECGALCLQGESCAGKILNLAKAGFDGAKNVAGAAGGPVGEIVVAGITGVAKLAQGLVYPICH